MSIYPIYSFRLCCSNTRFIYEQFVIYCDLLCVSKIDKELFRMKVARGETLSLEKKNQRAVTRKTKQIKKKLKSGEIKVQEDRKVKKLQKEQKRGLIYIGHLPHGFYEDEISQYFKQFGKVTNVKVCRSKNTGNSKGYGYVEFFHPEVAKIAADTMNNYIMFKKRLIAKFVPSEQRPKYLFYGRQSMPNNYSKLRRRNRNNSCRNKNTDDETHLKQCKTYLTRLQKKLDRIRKLGIDYDLKPVDVPDELIK